MAASDSDHNYYEYSRASHRQSVQSSGYDPSMRPLDSAQDQLHATASASIPPLPAYVYTRPIQDVSKRPSLSTNFEQYASNASINGFTSAPPDGTNSPDPHEFYRPYQDSFRKGSAERLGRADIVVAGLDDGMTNSRHSQLSTPISARTSGLSSSTYIQRQNGHRSPRSSPAPFLENGDLSSPRPTPHVVTTARNRQASLKDLVNKFNQTPDEVPPLPRKQGSRNNSATPSPVVSNGVRHLRARTPSRNDAISSKASVSGSEQSETPSRPSQRRRRLQEKAASPIKDTGSDLVSSSIVMNPHASMSMTDLSPRRSRRPLFGEVLAPQSDRSGIGHGIPGQSARNARRRRGSEGSSSMHSPNPMFPDERHPTRVSPSSPTAWYLGVTPSLEGINVNKPVPPRPSGVHRRSRSDHAGEFGKVPVASALGSHMAKMTPPQENSSPPQSPTQEKRNPQSRIPISARRTSVTSDSGNSSGSMPSSLLGRPPNLRFNPAKGPDVQPRTSSQASSPVRHPRPSPRRSPRARDQSPARRPNPLLKAFISAPMDKKSPPLRSSRPRQPVSSASTSASRARAVDRLQGQTQPSSSARHSRERKPNNLPELGGVDFAARRQRIQQAFTKTVKENERREEERIERKRMSMVLEAQMQHQDVPGEVHTDQNLDGVTLDVVPGDDKSLPGGRTEFDGEVYATPAEEFSEKQRELTIDTDHMTERSVLDLTQEDSPTLGITTRFSTLNTVPERMQTPTSEAEPMSAVTTDTAGTADTFFDDEPQDETHSETNEAPSLLHARTDSLLDQVMNLRAPSPNTPASSRKIAPTEESASEMDDRESIQIMLGDTPVSEKANAIDVTRGLSPEEKIVSEATHDRSSKMVPTSLPELADEGFGESNTGDGMVHVNELAVSQPQAIGHNSTSTAASVHTQPWSPASMESPQTGRSTLDSDAIDGVYENYYESGQVNPESKSEAQQPILSQSPNLARKGGWDSKKVTQLYLQNLGRNKYLQSGVTPEPLRFTTKQSQGSNTSNPNIPEIQGDKGQQDVNAVFRFPADSQSQSPEPRRTPGSASLEVRQDSSHRPSSSLNHPDDWANTSPSLVDWIHHQASDTPEDTEIPSIKDWTDPSELSKAIEAMDMERALTPRIPSDVRPRLPEIQSTEGGLGIDINVEPPNEGGLLDTPADNSMPSDRSAPYPQSADISSMPPPNKTPPPPPSKELLNRELPEPPAGTNDAAKMSGTTLQSQERQSLEGTVNEPECTSKATSPSPDKKRLIRRRHIIKELVDTEHSFGQDMKVVDDIYKGTSNVIIISAEDVKVLFGNSDQIVAFSTNFLDALKQSARSIYVLPKSRRWRSKRTSGATTDSRNTDDQSSIGGSELSDEDKDRKTFVGEAFGHHMAQMEKVYAEYLKNHDAANQKLQALQKNEKVKIWLKECRAYAHDLTSAWDLDSLLVKPVQRVLKYPLLLKELLEVTPENHPDFTALEVAAREMVGVSMRINEMKRRADLMEQVTNPVRKKGKDEGRLGFPKAFGRRTEKLRQQVGISENVEDKEYNVVSEKFGLHFFQLQVVMRDVEMYTNDVQVFSNRFNDFVLAIEGYIDVGQTSYPEVESKWRKFRMSMREILMTALTDHTIAVRKNVIDPMTTLLKLHDGPQKLMHKRTKRLMDFAKFKAIKDRGEKPDKKTIEQGEQFMAINDTLKDELPKLFALTGKLVEACLNNFVQLQLQWQIIWRRKLSQAIDDHCVPGSAQEIVDAFSGDFRFTEAQVLSLGICNGSLLADAANLVNFLSPATTLNGDDMSSPRRPSTNTVSSTIISTSNSNPRTRTLSHSSDISPALPTPGFGERHSGSFSYARINETAPHLASGHHTATGRRIRASSAVSGQSPRTPEVPGAFRDYSASTTPVNSTSRPSHTAMLSRQSTDESPSLPQLDIDTAGFQRLSSDSPALARQPSDSTYPTPTTASTITARDPPPRTTSPSNRYSGFFSSAMPMSDSPRTQSPSELQGQYQGQPSKDIKVLFLAASVYEFNIDRARREAGFPYLTYVAGEIFDVIAEKGELWLAKNQDDSTNQVGWIWNKHFAKLAS